MKLLPRHQMRINKYLSKAGIASRRAADTIIRRGRVKVNGAVVTELGVDVDELKDEISVDDKLVRLPDKYVYLVLNKPVGYLVTCSDDYNRPKVTDLVGRYSRAVRPVGRLDLDTSGLLLLTSDGELAFRLSHPRYRIDKKYIVKCEGRLSDDGIGRLTGGIELEDGKTSPSVLELISRNKNSTSFYLTIHEGKKRQIRRMCKAVGHEVSALSRIQYGDILLGNLKSGAFRPLDEDEINSLKSSVNYE